MHSNPLYVRFEILVRVEWFLLALDAV